MTFSYSSDEETGGRWGTQWLLSNVDAVRADACLIGDQSGADRLAVGEKGMCWLRVCFSGQSSHAAYGSSSSAIRRLSEALPILYSLEDLSQEPELVSGADPLECSVTVNVGKIEGGVSLNLVAGTASADVDIRIPHGLSVDDVVGVLRRRLDKACITCEIEDLRATDPTMTDPGTRIVGIAMENCQAVLGRPSHRSIRVGASDARFFRRHSIPTIVYGPQAHNMGAPGEYVDVDELMRIARVHAGIAADFPGGGIAMRGLAAALRSMRDGRAGHLIAAFSIGWVFMYTDRAVFSPVLNAIGSDFDVTAGRLGLIGSVFYLAYAAFQIPVGLAAEKIGRCRLLIVGFALFGISTMLSGLATGFLMLLILGFFTGLRQATYYPIQYSIAAEAVPPQNRTLSLALINGGMGVGVGGGILFAAFVAFELGLGWRFSLIGTGLLTVGVAFWLGKVVEESHDRRPLPKAGAARSLRNVMRRIKSGHMLPASALSMGSSPFSHGCPTTSSATAT